MEKIREIFAIKRNRIICIVSILVVVMIIIASLFLLNKPKNILAISKDKYEIELGEKLDKDVLVYLDISKLTKTNKKDLKENAKLELPNKKYLKESGKYKVKITHNSYSITKEVTVIDTVAPQFDVSDNLTVPLGTKFTEEDLKNMFKVTELNKYKLTIDNGGYNGDVEGTYTITANAVDKAKNETSYSFTITVSSSVTEQVHSENTTQATSVVIDAETGKVKPQTTPAGSGTSSNNGGGTTPSQNAVTVKSVSIRANSTTSIDVDGLPVAFTAVINPSNVSGLGYGSYNWSTSSDIISIVGGQGLASISVRGVSVGNATLTCTVNGVSSSINVTVKERVQASASIDNISLIILNTNGTRTTKTMSQLGASQSGSNYTVTATLGGGQGICFNMPGVGQSIGGFKVALGSGWYPTSGYSQSLRTIVSSNQTYVFIDSGGNKLTLHINMGSINCNETIVDLINGSE